MVGLSRSFKTFWRQIDLEEEIGDPSKRSLERHPCPLSPHSEDNPEKLIALFATARALADREIAPVEDVPMDKIRATNKYLGRKAGKYDMFRDHEAPVLAKTKHIYSILDGHHRIASEHKAGKKKTRAHVYHVKDAD